MIERQEQTLGKSCYFHSLSSQSASNELMLSIFSSTSKRTQTCISYQYEIIAAGISSWCMMVKRMLEQVLVRQTPADVIKCLEPPGGLLLLHNEFSHNPENQIETRPTQERTPVSNLLDASYKCSVFPSQPNIKLNTGIP